MASVLPTPEPADPVEGQPGHFDHSNWVKASLKALDAKSQALDAALAAVPRARVWAGYAAITGTGDIAFPPGQFTAGPFVVVTLAESTGVENYVPVVLPSPTADKVVIGIKHKDGSGWATVALGVQIVAVQP